MFICLFTGIDNLKNVIPLIKKNELSTNTLFHLQCKVGNYITTSFVKFWN